MGTGQGKGSVPRFSQTVRKSLYSSTLASNVVVIAPDVDGAFDSVLSGSGIRLGPQVQFR